LAEILRNAQSLEVAEEVEEVHGADCVKIEASTRYGRFEVWVDAQSGFFPRRIRCLKQGEDLLYDTPLSESALTVPKGRQVIPRGPVSAPKQWSWEMDVPELAEYEGVFYPVETISKIHASFITGEEVLRTWHAKIVNVDFDPDFDNIQAFRLIAPDGTEVRDSDSPGLALELRNGEVVLAVDEAFVKGIDETVTTGLSGSNVAQERATASAGLKEQSQAPRRERAHRGLILALLCTLLVFSGIAYYIGRRARRCS